MRPELHQETAESIWCRRPFECSLLGSGIFSCNMIFYGGKKTEEEFFVLFWNELCAMLVTIDSSEGLGAFRFFFKHTVCELKALKCTIPPRKAFTLRNTSTPNDVMFLYSP